MKKLVDLVLVFVLVGATGYLLCWARQDGTLLATPSPTRTLSATFTATARPTLKPTLTPTTTRTATPTVAPSATATGTDTRVPTVQTGPLEKDRTATPTMQGTVVARHSSP